VDQELLKILACPVCKSGVELRQEKIVCTKCSCKYPIRNGVPVMLPEEAEK